MKKYIFTGLLIVAFAASCSEDDAPGKPSISLSQTAVTASAGDEVSVTVTTKTEAGFQNLVVTKLWDGVPVVGEQDIFTEELDEAYVYTVVEADADHVVTLNFTVLDDKDKAASKDLVISIELTARQLLLKYNWRLSEEIWKEENTNEISSAYDDDVYRFNADGTYDKSIGAKADDFGDLITNYCYYNLNSTTLRLLMSRSENFFGTDAVDTLDIILISDTQLRANITYKDLDQLDPKYSASEDFEKRFVAVAKTASFDPYMPGHAEGDDDGPGDCREVDLDND